MSLTLRITGFNTLHSLLDTNRKLYNYYCQPSTCKQEPNVDGTRDLILFWDNSNAWALAVESVVIATGIPAERITVTNTEDTDDLHDDQQATRYNLRTNVCNLEDVLHRLFTQLYDDDWLFNLRIGYNASDVEVSFETLLYTKEEVETVLDNYII